MNKTPISVVRVILNDSMGRILLLRRLDDSEYGGGQYCLPGGKVDYGKTVEEACADEVKEETDLDITDLEFLFYQDNLPAFSGGMHVINLYFSAHYSGDIKINYESISFEWVEPSALGAYNVAFKNAEGIKKYLKMTNNQ